MDREVLLKKYENGVKRGLISQDEIQEAIQKAGKFIDEIYDGSPLCLLVS